MYKQSVKEKAVELRKQGNSYAIISSQLNVAKSTLSVWLKGVNFIPNDVFVNNVLRNNQRLVEIKRVDKMVSLKEAHSYADINVGKINKRDNFIFGLGIYLGEGSKSNIRISNSDPRIIKFSINWFRNHFGLVDSNFRIRLHIYPDKDGNELVKFWSSVVDLDKKYFFDSYIDVRSNKKKDRRGVLPYGTAHLSIVSNGNKNFGVLLHRKIIASIDQVLQ